MKRYRINNLIRAIGILTFYSVVFLYTIIFNNSTGWLLFFFLTFLLALDVLTLLPSLKKIQVRSIERPIYRMEQTSNVQVEVFCSRSTLWPIPCLMVFSSANNLVGMHYLALYSGQKKELNFEWKPPKRGIFQELSFEFVSTDLFRLFSKQFRTTVTGPFVIMPTLQLSLAEQLYQQLLTLSADFATPFGNQTFSIRNFRRYQLGDSFNLVDWKQSGKRNELIVKEYEHESEADTHFVFYGLAHEKFELLLSIYYSFVYLTKNKLSFHQTILAEVPHATPKELTMAAATPLLGICELPAFTNKKVVIFAPHTSDQLVQQLHDLTRNNEVFFITFEGEALSLQWHDHVKRIKEGGHILEK
ncbi:DUF58 domain-containing protein [Enterococcus caccae]|uniref:DUF58 domain-containing protein n=1 Tax=Enterococcus caccae ATCC BAA-1240 TaxID=1158612 RepID=R3W9P2_9ENTE|nr:DUF58 domain-containing protein [Enterococcus caccae]EOL44611.1 hypothetical protein UC7_02154 [Enterococcus caccae ATCC BAA-1240]EOT58754.1 hypothetical protein I580_02926 [Enterococcus caccae ATCC BAA-1240]OJG25900.1 hypothetical protein RU98_GL000777 [Enterococcus caccae]